MREQVSRSVGLSVSDCCWSQTEHLISSSVRDEPCQREGLTESLM